MPLDSACASASPGTEPVVLAGQTEGQVVDDERERQHPDGPPSRHLRRAGRDDQQIDPEEDERPHLDDLGRGLPT